MPYAVGICVIGKLTTDLVVLKVMTSVFFVNDDENDDKNDENILNYR